MKSFKIIIDEDALVDLADAARWYNGRLENLGTRFKKTSKTTNIRIKEKRCRFHHSLWKNSLFAN